MVGEGLSSIPVVRTLLRRDPLSIDLCPMISLPTLGHISENEHPQSL